MSMGGPQKTASVCRQKVFVIEVTQRCNHDCRHCYNVWKGRRPYPAGELSAERLLDVIVGAADETGAGSVTLSGGEPLLRPDLIELVDALASRGLATTLITNGTLLNPSAISALVPRVGLFELPLLSADRAIHDHLSGAPGAFDRVTRSIADLKLAGARVVVVFVATRPSLPTWRETAELALALGVDGILFNRFNPGGRGLDHLDELQASPEQLTLALDCAEELVTSLGLSISCGVVMPPCLFDTTRWPHLSFGLCAAGTERAYFTMDPLGNLRPCNHSPTILGNLRDSSFSELAASEPMSRFRAARPRFCAGCWVEGACLGGCKAAAEAAHGSPDQLDPFLEAFGANARPSRWPLPW